MDHARGGGGARGASDSDPFAAAAERWPLTEVPARGAHPSSPVGTELGGLHVPSYRDEVSPSDVLVLHGQGGHEEVLDVLRQIADTCSRAAKASTDGGRIP